MFYKISDSHDFGAQSGPLSGVWRPLSVWTLKAGEVPLEAFFNCLKKFENNILRKLEYPELTYVLLLYAVGIGWLL